MSNSMILGSVKLFLVSRPFAVLQPLDRGLLVSPLEVVPFPVGDSEPPFCAEEWWLESRVEELTARLAQEETNTSLVCRPLHTFVAVVAGRRACCLN